MELTAAQRIAQRFVGLSVEQRQQILAQMQASGQSFRLLPIVPARQGLARIPLSYAQQRLLFLWQLEPDSPAYNVPLAVRLKGALDPALLQQALDALVQRHESLRTRFAAQEGEFYQDILDHCPLPIEWVEFAETPSEASLSAAVDAALKQPFDLQAGPLLRVTLLRVEAEHHVLALSMHHIIADGWSSDVLVQEFIQLYSALAEGRQAQLPDLPIQYADYAIWQRAWLEAGEAQRQLAYWQAQLGDEQPVLSLPLDFERPATPSQRGAVLRVDIPGAQAEALRSQARKGGYTVFVLVLAAMAVVLSRYSGQADIRIGAPNAGRNRKELEGLIGFFINTQVLRVQVDERATFAALLEQVKAVIGAAQSHQELPFEQLVDALLPARNLAHNPLFQFKLNQHVAARDAGRKRLGTLEVEGFARNDGDARFDLAFDFSDKADGIEGYFTYATELFERATIERMAASLRRVLDALTGDLQQAIVDCPELPALMPAPTQAYPHGDVLALWRQAMAQGQAHGGVRAGERFMTQAGLEAASNRLADYLRQRGVGAGSIVALCLPRSIEWVSALLAVLKTGAAYLPLDPQQPQERLQQLLVDSAAAVLLHEPGDQRFTGLEGVQVVACDPAQWATCSDRPVEPAIAAEQPAYLIYTSGSTGQPKAVVVSHGALASYTQAVLERLQLPAAASMAMVSTPAADLGHTVLFGALASGRLLHLLPQELAFDPDGFASYMAQHQVGVLKLVPSHLQGLLQADRAADVLPTAALILGGEACSWGLLQKVRALRPGCRVINHYGPTETTVGVLTFEPGQPLPGCRTVPVGRPLGNACAQLLDAYLNPLAAQVPGELYLGGQGVAQGYLGQPALTAERFVPTEGGARLYRTGDRARLTADGLIEFIGRADDQVKIRGYRVEPGEIGRMLADLPAVNEAVVLALPLEGDAERLQLVAYVVAAAGGTVEQLQALLLARLPDYMVPAQMVLLERLPLTANGKLDKRALPVPGAASRGYVAPQGDIEETLAAVWADVLKLERVGSSDNFFELGGDSILSLQIIARAKRQGIRISPKQLFEQQTIAQLAQVAKRIEAKPAPAAAAEGASLSGEVGLLPAQARFFDMHIAQPAHWNQSVLLKPTSPVQAQHLEAALRAVVAQHDALRLRFTRGAGQWQARFQPLGNAPLLQQRNLDTLSELDAAGNQVQASLNLEHGPLLRGELFDFADGQQRLLLVIHHLVVDGVSWRVLLEDLQTAYQQLLAGQAVNLPAKTTSVQAWAARLASHASSPALQAQRDYWLQTLAGEHAELPRDNPQGSLANSHARTATTRLDAARTARLLRQAPAAYRTQVNDLLLTALARTLCQWSAQDNVLVQLEGHGREDLFDDLELSRTVGWFTSLFPVRLTPGHDLGQSIKAIKEQLRAVPDKGLGYGLLRYLGDAEVRDQLERAAQARVTFNYLGQFDASFDAEAGALFTPGRESAGRTQCVGAQLGNWLGITGQVYAGELFLEWTYSADVHHPATIENLAQAYEQALAELVEHCCDGRHLGVTPSDFPLAALTQAQLDSLPLAAGQIADVYPLSPMQQGMLFHTLYDQQAGNYINQLRVDVDGLDVQRFRQAWQATLDAHDILRSGFILQGELGQAVQVVRKAVELPCSEHDWRSQPALEQALQALAESEREHGFDLSAAPLLRLVLVRTGDTRHHLIYTNHHILMDGWSTSRLLGEVLQRYAGLAPQAQASHYRDYIAWLQGQDAAVAEAFWKAQLAALDEPTRLAQAIAGSAGSSGSGQGNHRLAFDPEQTARIEAFARANRVTVNTLVQSAWLLLLQRCTGQASVCFGATVAGRPADLPGVEEQIGLFINTVPVIGAPRAEQTVAEWIGQVQAGNLAVREFEHTPLYEVQRWAGQGGDALFDSILVFENYPVAEALQQGAPAGLRFGDVAVQEQTNYPLTLVVELGTTLSMQYSHDRALWSDETIGRLAGYFANLLQALVENADAVIGELPMLGLAEQKQMVEGWNETHATYPNERSIHQLIEAQVFATPDAPALVFGEQTLSYAELNRRANQLAHRLRELGVGPDVLVGIAMERSLEMVIGLLGIVKAGGAYVPLDPEYPQARLRYMFDDSGIALLLSQSHLRDSLPIPAGLRCLELDSEDLSGYRDANPDIDVAPLNLAYVIYTSGSTGRPKGAGNSHRALVNRLWWMQKAYALDASDSVLQKTPFSFDVSVWEFFWPLMTGARLVVAQPGAHRDPQLLVDTIDHYGISTLHFVPSMLQAFMAHEAVERCVSLRRLVCSGEALPAELARQTLQRLPAARLYNLYGPTEAAIDVTHWSCQPDESISVPIGQPIDNLKTHILDGSLQPAVRGSAGELYLGGVGLARGYHQRPALTAERFVPDPFSRDGGRLYRTGDLARYRADGVIDYAGRIDHQVKIRGLRIELGEIEARLLELPSVREAVVLAQDGPSGKQLVAYVVPADSTQEQGALRDSLRAALKASVPDYMVPAHLLLLEQLPLTPNGKLDRKALPQADASQLQGEYVAPQSALEQQIAAIWAQVLKLQRVGLTDNFFELGGDSIVSLQLVSRARQAGLEFTPRELFEHQTVQRLALVARQQRTAQDGDPPAASAADALAALTQAQRQRLPVPMEQIADLYPLSPMQQGMLFYTLQGPEAGLYINQTAVSVAGLDIDRFADAWRQVIARHDILRTAFWSDPQLHEPMQLVLHDVALPLQVLDWRQRDCAPQALKALAAEDAARGFQLASAPLMRLTLVRLEDGGVHLIWTRHHILMDGWSDSRLLGEVLQTYHGQAPERPVVQFGNYIRWLGAQPQAQLERFWSATLGGLETPTLLTGSVLPRPAPELDGHAALYLRWDRPRTRRLREQAQRLRVTPNTLIQAAWLLVLQRYTGQSTVCFGATVAGRPPSLAGADEMLGLFINTLPVVQTPEPGQRVETWLQQLQAYNIEMRDHEHAALANVQRWAGRPGQALFDSIVVFENFPVDQRLAENSSDSLQFGDVSARGVTNYAMDLCVELGNTLLVEFMYLRSCFSEAATEALRGSFECLLHALLDDPQATLGSLNMLTPAQLQQAATRNRLAGSPQREPLLAEQIARHAMDCPDAVAVVCAGQQLTYRELEQRANRLAHRLIAVGARPEATVGIALERSVDVIVAFLAVMKTGAAYVPLDIDYPQERLQWIVADAGMHALITTRGLRPRFAQVQCCVELDTQVLDGLPLTPPQVNLQRDNLAYLIYTSGSTGKPKGVAVSHEQIRMHCQAIASLYDMDRTTRELLFMSFAFDGAQERWLSTLSSGGCLVVRENRLWTAEETWQVLHQQRIDIACFPPAYLQQLAEFAESQDQAAPPVRVYCFGGDAVPNALFEQVKRSLRPQWLTNGYGPTETVVTPLLWKASREQACEAVFAPIGAGVGERTLYVLDPHLNPLPDGVAGELYIGGEGVARGYHQRPSLTAERFVADPSGHGLRLYRTGDRVRRRSDGVIDFIGRMDNQLKVRGFRIEPGEIEARLRDLSEVRDAVVVARDTATGKQLIGYVVTRDQHGCAQALREALAAELPDYMVPAQLVLMPALPLTPNGKVDRNALPAPEFAGQRVQVAPRNAIERALADIWQQVLDVPSVGVEDNFFELGGDSLRVLKMLSQVRACEALPIELKLRDVIARPTIAELSGYADKEASLDPLLLLNSRVADATPLFCLHAGFGTVFDYEPLARRLDGRCAVYGIQCRMLLEYAWEDDSLQAMAIDYAQYIRQKQPQGPYQLLGWSLGGALAVLVAHELESQGQQVAMLSLVDSFIPQPGQVAPDADWRDDLRGFLEVMLGADRQRLVVPAIAADCDSDGLAQIIDAVRATQAGQSAYAEIGSAELAHTFVVAMKLKALSQQMAALPVTVAEAACWWAGSGNFDQRIAGPARHASVDAGHYDILRHPEVLDGLVALLQRRDLVGG
ncbi:amino acid adenylation domain-containing protein [Pseudomonas sp. BCRC 81390]|uniref:non-ribosomal peptide synthetase n=1 Tax=Pseudomonas sp. BCRC 81390 TaxID=3054778 RepID=UPI0025924332|nr:non-ribosomal peptide synthetase [Pseudomonas sp. BCRC 81390]MDM3885477.1 amino acid adenylation domain-containing protein [Pseudomonas sp. BCRC 81390]